VARVSNPSYIGGIGRRIKVKGLACSSSGSEALSSNLGTAHTQSQMLVAQACNPSYSGNRDQEDLGSNSARANSSPDPILKKPITKKGWLSGSR
jgi:hypothetical protein